MDQTTNSGETPLDILGHTGYVEKRDKHGMPPLHHVCKNGYSEHLIRFLIQAHPASITIQDSDGRTPFHYYTSIQGRELCNEVIALLQPLNKRRKFQVAAPTPALLKADNEVAQVSPLAGNEVVPRVPQIQNEPKPQDLREIKIEITQIKSNIVELKEEIIDKYSNLKSEMVELKSAIEIELNSFKASVQSDMTEIKSMLCQFGAI